MRLIIKREQDKKDLTLSFRVELTPEESELKDKFNLDKMILTEKTKDNDGLRTTILKDIIDGISYYSRFKDLALLDAVEVYDDLDENEKLIKKACQVLKNFLTALAEYRGEEEIEFETPEDAHFRK